jgi:hypothetical protein
MIDYVEQLKITFWSDRMNEVQQTAMKLMENQIQNVGFTPIQALTMCLSYYKGGFYEELNDQEFEVVIKAFVDKYM